MKARSQASKSGARSSFSVGLVARVLPMVLLILFVSQGLSALLSVLSFERIYLQNLTADYEIAGQNVQRKIQKALKFGKRMDGFVGLQRFVAPLFSQLKALDAVVISAPTGRVYFWYALADGGTPAIRDLGPDRPAFDIATSFDWEAATPTRISMAGQYAMMLPIVSPLDGQRSLLTLVFDKKVIETAKHALLADARLTMGLTLVVTALLITILLRLRVFNRIRWNSASPVPSDWDAEALSRLPQEMVPIYDALQRAWQLGQTDKQQLRALSQDLAFLAQTHPRMAGQINLMIDKMEHIGHDATQPET